jgi:hypothetical protein
LIENILDLLRNLISALEEYMLNDYSNLEMHYLFEYKENTKKKIDSF